MPTLSEIHHSFINDNFGQMAKQINEYGLSDFWADYNEFIRDYYDLPINALNTLADVIINYHRITNR